VRRPLRADRPPGLGVGVGGMKPMDRVLERLGRRGPRRAPRLPHEAPAAKDEHVLCWLGALRPGS
jgi:hypothetical protein